MLSHYRLDRQPFGVTPDPRYLYLSASHRKALTSLSEGIRSRRGFMSFIAEPGMGKTTILFQLLSQLQSSARTVFLFQTLCGPKELLRDLLHDMGVVDIAADIAGMQQQLNSVLLAEARDGRRVIVVIDEAQNLEDSALEMLRMLSNFETTSQKLMQIILAGQIQLREKLASPHLLQLRQRMSVFAGLQPFDAEETQLYIHHRLQVAGYDFKTPLFTKQAETLIARYSGGIPRNINNICFNAMSLAYALKQRTIEKEVVREAAQDLNLEAEERPEYGPEERKPNTMPRKPAVLFQGALAWRKRLAAGVVLLLPLLLFSSGRRPETTAVKKSGATTTISESRRVMVSADRPDGTDAAIMSGVLPVVEPQTNPSSSDKPAATVVVPRPAAVEKVTEPEAEQSTDSRSVPLRSRPALDTASTLPGKPIPPAAPDVLWEQVKNANRDAEIELARMYLEGTSVPRNCAQAQVLLEDAARHGKPHALDLLNESQCH